MLFAILNFYYFKGRGLEEAEFGGRILKTDDTVGAIEEASTVSFMTFGEIPGPIINPGVKYDVSLKDCTVCGNRVSSTTFQPGLNSRMISPADFGSVERRYASNSSIAGLIRSAKVKASATPLILTMKSRESCATFTGSRFFSSKNG